MSGSRTVWDSGLQPERTYLAWRRLALALLGLAVAIPRLAWAALGPWTVVPALLVGAGAVVLLGGGHRRYRRTHTVLTSPVPATLPDGRLALFTAIVALVLAAVALIIVGSAASSSG